MEFLEVRVYFTQHTKTGLWKAESPDIKGMLVFDRDLEALKEEVPSLLQTLLEEDGKRVYSVRSIDSEESEWQLPLNSTLARVDLQAV